jgi:hypothetical protein
MLTPSRRLSIAAFVAVSLALVFSFFFIANRSSHEPTSSKSLPDAAKSQGANSPVAAMTNPEVMKAYGQLPLSFEANQGQSAADVKFLSRGNGYLLSLRGQEADLTFRQAPTARPIATNRLKMYRTHRVPRAPEKFSTLRMRLDGSNPSAQITGQDRTATQINYFLGNDPKKWQTDVPAYSKVKYAGIYPGVDLMFYGNRRELEYDFVLAPDADPKSIALNVEGARKIHLDAHGNLLLDVPGGEVKFKKPDVYQDSNGTRREIAGNYSITNRHEVRFAVADYDRTQPLTIDPVVIYSTYVGGSGSPGNGGDMAMGIALDSLGNAYIGGVTFSADLKQFNGMTSTPPTPVTTGGSSGFVAELNPTGTTALYLTYLGGATGNDTQDGIQSIAVDATKNIYVTGFTQSSDFPVSNSPTSPNKPFEANAPASVTMQGSAFVTRLNPTQAGAAQLAYSSYLGGGGALDQGNGIVVGSGGDAYVTGVTLSTDFPTANASVAPFSTALLSPNGNAFVTEVATNGTGASSLLFSSYLGGTGLAAGNFPYADHGAGITLDSSRNAYVVGTTDSADFPTKGTQVSSCSKNSDSSVFVAVIGLATPATPVLSYSTCLAGSTAEVGQAIALGPNNLAYLTGATFSTDFPVTTNTIPLGFPGPPPVRSPSSSVAFVATVNTTNGALGYSTLLGGSNGDGGFGIAADSTGVAYVTGQTGSVDFPVTPGALQSARSNGFGSTFVSKINASAGGQGGADLLYSTYYGGNGDGAAKDPDSGTGIALSGTNAYVSGQATPGLSTTAPVYQASTNNSAGLNAFVAELPLIASLTATPNPLAFGTQTLNMPSAVMTVTVTNNSSGALPVTFAVTGANAADFKAVSGATNGCTATLAAAGTCTVDVVFTPTVSGAEAGTLTIGTAPNTVAIALTGTGSTLTATPNPLAFGNQTLNMPSASMSVTVTNNSGAALPVTFAVTGANASDFVAATAGTATPCMATLPAAGTCTIGVIFTPTLVPAGAETGTLTIGTLSNTVAVALTGTGTAATGTFTVTAPATFPLTSGVSGAIPVTVTGSGGFTGMVNLTCAGGTASVTSCTMMPTSVSLTAGTPTQTAMANVVATISLVVPPDSLKTPPPSSLRQVVFLALGIVMLFMIPITQRRRARLGMVAAMLVFVVVAGCGGGGGPHTGTGTVTITGTAPGSPALPPQTATVNLTITK